MFHTITRANRQLRWTTEAHTGVSHCAVVKTTKTYFWKGSGSGDWHWTTKHTQCKFEQLPRIIKLHWTHKILFNSNHPRALISILCFHLLSSNDDQILRKFIASVVESYSIYHRMKTSRSPFRLEAHVIGPICRVIYDVHPINACICSISTMQFSLMIFYSCWHHQEEKFINFTSLFWMGIRWDEKNHKSWIE